MTLPLEPGPPEPGRLAGRRQGFTLIELLVVLTIVSLLLAAVPAALSGLGGLRLHRAARDLTGALRASHAAAVAEGRTITIRFDPRRVAWSSPAEAAPHFLAPAVERLALDFASPLGAGRPSEIRFMADGSATAATLTLWGGGRSAIIRIDWPAGQVRLDD
jgi:type II secretion system protein H